MWSFRDAIGFLVPLQVLLEVARSLGVKCHARGTVLSIEGPRFSSRAESLMFRQWGADVINMTTVPEVVLAKEAGLCYASIAMATDYDCWKEHEEAVSRRREVMTRVFFKALMSRPSLLVTWIFLFLMYLFFGCGGLKESPSLCQHLTRILAEMSQRNDCMPCSVCKHCFFYLDKHQLSCALFLIPK